MSSDVAFYELAFPDGLYQYVYNMCYLHSINIYNFNYFI